MSKEIIGVVSSGTLYARLRNKAGLWWNGSTFEAYNASNWATYVIAMTEEGSSQTYVADFPSVITASGTYEYFVHRTTTSAAEGDNVVNSGKVDWTGSSSVGSETGSMTGSDWRDYILRCGFKRTDKDTELYEATTDAIQIMRRRFMFDEAEVETTTTDTIATLGDFKLNVESDFGLLMGIVLEDDDTGTPLIHVPKWQFDQLYPSINVETDRGYPRHFSIYAGSIYIGPIPDQTSYIYRKSYSRRAGTITSSTAGVPFTNLYRDILGDLTQSILYGRLDEPGQEDRFFQKFEKGFFEATRRERMNSGEHCFNVRPFGC